MQLSLKASAYLLIFLTTVLSTLSRAYAQQSDFALGMSVAKYLEFAQQAEQQGMLSVAGSQFMTVTVLPWQSLLLANLYLESNGKPRIFCVTDNTTYVPNVLFPSVTSNFRARAFADAEFRQQNCIMELIKFLATRYPC
jgi:hypothetical protein